MTSPLPDGQRHLIPRWRSPANTIKAGELGNQRADAGHADARSPGGGALAKAAAQRAIDLDLAIQCGSSRAEPGFELLASAVAVRDQGLVEQALDALGDAGDTVRSSIQSVLEPRGIAATADEPAAIIARARNRLQRDPRQPLAWFEVARGQILMGQVDKAARALLIARHLAPDSRLVIRAQARLYVHTGDYGRAHDVLLGHPRTASDPWLRATEIAVAPLAEQKPKHLRSSRVAVLAGDWSLQQSSEVAAAVATAEYAAGNGALARKLITIGASGGHDNALAQAEWLQHEGLSIPGVDLNALASTHQFGFEARARHSYYTADWEQAWTEGEAWRQDQAFASLPTRFLSLVAIVGLRDAQRSLDAAEAGLGISPSSATLLNNAAFASLILGDLPRAQRYLLQALPHHPGLATAERIPLLATVGLLAYRAGSAEMGAKLYQAAAELAGRAHKPELARTANLYHFWVRQGLDLDLTGLPDVRYAAFDDPAFAAMRDCVVERTLPFHPLKQPALVNPALTALSERALGEAAPRKAAP